MKAGMGEAKEEKKKKEGLEEEVVESESGGGKPPGAGLGRAEKAQKPVGGAN